MYKTLKLLLVVIAFGIFVYKAYVFLDPDFGWHYRMGEVITNTGIPKTDPFSYTMASFPFVDHEWLANKLVYFSYDAVGFFGLSLLFAFFAGYRGDNPVFRRKAAGTVLVLSFFFIPAFNQP